MKIYEIEAVILGNNSIPETHVERVMASGLQEACEIMSRVAQDTMYVITELKITETTSRAFDHKTLKAA